jgi:uncharacterized protein YjiS (DUF1127 family)
MAYITEAHPTSLNLFQRISEFRARVAAASAQRKLYTQTVNELSALSNRDLADLGLSRSMITGIALESAYGVKA